MRSFTKLASGHSLDEACVPLLLTSPRSKNVCSSSIPPLQVMAMPTAPSISQRPSRALFLRRKLRKKRWTPSHLTLPVVTSRTKTLRQRASSVCTPYQFDAAMFVVSSDLRSLTAHSTLYFGSCTSVTPPLSYLGPPRTTCPTEIAAILSVPMAIKSE
jgi:hypothetical protein